MGGAASTVVEWSVPRRRERATAPAARGCRTTGGRAGRRVGRRAGGRRVAPPPPTERGAPRRGGCGGGPTAWPWRARGSAAGVGRNGVCGRAGRLLVAEQTHLCGGGSGRPAWRTPPRQATVAVRLGGEGVLTRLAGGGRSRRVERKGVLLLLLCLLLFRGVHNEGPGGQMICPRLLGWHAPRLFVTLCALFNFE